MKQAGYTSREERVHVSTQPHWQSDLLDSGAGERNGTIVPKPEFVVEIIEGLLYIVRRNLAI